MLRVLEPACMRESRREGEDEDIVKWMKKVRLFIMAENVMIQARLSCGGLVRLYTKSKKDKSRCRGHDAKLKSSHVD